MDSGAKDYGKEYGGAKRMRYQGGGAVPALAGDEVIGHDEEYEDLYSDVNVGQGFQQMQQPMVQMQSSTAGLGGFLAPKANPGTNSQLSELKGQIGAMDSSQSGRAMGISFNTQFENLGFQKVVSSSSGLPVNGPSGAAIGLNQASMNSNPLNDQHTRPAIDSGSTMLFVGELHWWTTDVELENVLSQYGRVKEIKFFDERASGKSKGYCQVEFYDSIAAAMCKEGMDGHVFNGRACVVAFSSPQTIRQMGSSYANKNQAQGRRPLNDGVGRGGGINQQSNYNGDGGRNNGGRGGWGRGGPGMVNRGPGGGPIRGRGGPTGGRPAFGPGMGGPAFSGPLGGPMGQGMMGAGFDPNFMGRGGGYGAFPGPAYPGMVPSFPQVNPMGLSGVAPHVNPAFFGRGMANNGMGMGMGMGVGMGMSMGMMGPTGMDGQQGMWTEKGMGDEEEYDDGGSEHGHGDGSQEKGVRSNVASREEWGSERDWSRNSERRHRDERGGENERSERTQRYREENDDWDRGQSSSRSRSRSRAIPEEDYRRSRDVDYGKRRRE